MAHVDGTTAHVRDVEPLEIPLEELLSTQQLAFQPVNFELPFACPGNHGLVSMASHLFAIRPSF